jgi:hypothetical protein
MQRRLREPVNCMKGGRGRVRNISPPRLSFRESGKYGKSQSPPAAAHDGQLRAELERAGKPCGAHDMQIGGHARSEGLIVVTNNLREFARMPGLRAENWV